MWLVTAMMSCAPETGFNAVEDFDMVVTLYDKEFDFGAVETYAMPDSVVHLAGEDDILSRTINRDFDELILAEVADNLADLGYTRELSPETNPPDVIVLVSVTSTEFWGAYTSYPWWDYWGWYPGWGYYPGYGPGWGVGYPYGYTTVYSYTTGSLLIEMLDAGNPDDEAETIASVWAAGANGLLDDTPGNIEDRLVEIVERAFGQSPYLGTD
jgi:hypothetical protein